MEFGAIANEQTLRNEVETKQNVRTNAFLPNIKKEIPAESFIRTIAIVIRDINPQAPTHLLVIPKITLNRSMTLRKEEALLGHLLRVAARVANAEGLVEGGYRTVINNGAGAGQSVFHLHVHVLGGRR